MRSRRLAALAWLVAAASACGGSAANHEAMGDRAYLNRQFGEALVEYRLALKQRSSPRVHAKAGAAALHAGDLTIAASEYVELARSSDRRGEGADGLERVARAAMQVDDRAGLAAALSGLRQISEGRALGAFAAQLARGVIESGSPAEAITILPYAAAAAPDGRTQDSLILQYGRALSRSGRCEEGAGVYEGLIRRQQDAALVRTAQQGLLQCALGLGRAAVEQGAPGVAEGWFLRAVREAGDTPAARAAYLGLGDVLMGRNDFLGASEAYQRAMQGAAPGDSIAEVARQRLANISNAGTGAQ